MDDNRIEIVAGLDIPKTKSTIKGELNSEIKPDLDSSKALKIVCHIDEKSIASLQTELANISKGLKLNVPTISVKTEAAGAKNITAAVDKSIESTTHKVLTLKKTLADLDDELVAPFNVVENKAKNGIMDAERTMSVIQNRLSSLGTVTVKGKYDDYESASNINRITATIKANSGEVRELNFLLDQMGKRFEYIGGTYSDSGVAKVQQDLARLKKELATFEASHTSIKDGLIQPLTEARNALSELEAGVGSVEATERALDKLKTSAANIATNLKSTGSSFNVFDNAVNKAENFANVIKSLEMDINNLGASDKKSSLVGWLSEATEGLAKLKEIETQSGKGQEWSAQYKQVSSTIQDITNYLKVAQKEDSAFNKEFSSALKEEEKLLQAEQKRIQAGKELQEQQQHDYWQGRFEESIKGMTAENQELKAMKKYYEDLNKAAKETEQQQKKTFKQDNALETLRNRIAKTSAALVDYANKNERAVASNKLMSDGVTSFASKWQELVNRINSPELRESPEALRHLNEELLTFKTEAKAAGLAGETAFGKFLNSFKLMSSYITANMVFNFVKRQIRDMVNEVTALDTAMVELRKVTEATEEDFRKFQKSAGNTAKELGASITDVINATSTFARLGESLPDAEELGKVAILYQNVGDGITETQAAEDLVSTMKAFNIEAQNSIEIVDKFNEVGNNFAISSGGIGVALKRSASALAAGNNTLSESIALITTANTVAQDPTTVGQGIKTVSLRLRSTKTELEQIGEDAEGAAENISKLRQQMLALTGVDIQLDDTTYKSTYQILLEISKVWGQLDDLSRSSVLEQLFGKRQSNIGAAILENGELLEKVYKTAEGSAGSARREQEEYAKSIQYSLDSLKAAYQDLAQTVVNSDFVKGVVDTAKEFLEILTKIIDKFGTLPTLLTGLAAVGSFKGIGRPNRICLTSHCYEIVAG